MKHRHSRLPRLPNQMRPHKNCLLRRARQKGGSLMAKADFYMVYVSRKSDVGYKTLEEKMNLSVDWYRMSDSLWILHTTSDQEKWYSRLKPLCNYEFVC